MLESKPKFVWYYITSTMRMLCALSRYVCFEKVRHWLHFKNVVCHRSLIRRHVSHSFGIWAVMFTRIPPPAAWSLMLPLLFFTSSPIFLESWNGSRQRGAWPRESDSAILRCCTFCYCVMQIVNCQNKSTCCNINYIWLYVSNLNYRKAFLTKKIFFRCLTWF